MNLRHNDPVTPGVGSFKSADIGCQLITKDQNQISHKALRSGVWLILP